MKNVEEIFHLPPGVPARLLFQVGPNGEDPVVDGIETRLRSEGLRVIQEKGSGLTLRGLSKESVTTARKQLEEWISQIEVTRIELDQSSPHLVARLEMECSHSLNNMAWICGVAVKRSKNDTCVVEITGRPEAVSTVADSVYQIIVVTGGVVRDGLRESKSLFNRKKIDEEKNCLPKYRFFRDLEIIESRNIAAPLIPLSVFDRLSPAPVLSTDLRLEVFQRSVKIEKSESIPVQVIARLEDAVNVGTRITKLDHSVVDIRCSVCEEDLDFAEQIIKACALRSAPKNCDWASLVPKPGKHVRLRPIEQNRRVVCVEAAKGQLLILGRPLNVLRASADISGGKKIDGEDLILKRVHHASGQANGIGFSSESGEKRLFITLLIEAFSNPLPSALLERAIVIPARPLDNHSIARIEQKWNVVLIPCSATDWAIKHKNSGTTFETYAVISWEVKSRILAMMDLLEKDLKFYDFASLKFAIPDGFLTASVCRAIADVDLADIEKSMNVVCRNMEKESLVMVGGSGREAVLVASDLIQGKRLDSSNRFKLTVTSDFSNLSELRKEIGCFAQRSKLSDKDVEVVSIYPLRLAAAAAVLKKELSLEELLTGWKKIEVKKSKLRKKFVPGDSDSDYEFFTG